MKRIFIAIKTEPDGDLIRMISSVRAMLVTESIKWVDLSGIHITLAFLGDTSEDKIKVLDRMLREKCAGFGEFDFVLSGAGVFKSFTNPRVLWVGISQAERLSSLYGIIAKGVGGAGFKTEERNFRPHLTIGRVKLISDTAGLRSAIEKYKGIEFQIVRVKEVILFESILQKTGPLYIPLGKYPV